MALTQKHQRFCEEYIIDLNATQAAIRAGYSEDTAYSQGGRLLKDVEIKAEIERMKALRSEATQIDAAWVLRKSAELHQLAIDKVHIPGAAKALELVGKHVGVQAFKDRVEHTGQIAITISPIDDDL